MHASVSTVLTFVLIEAMNLSFSLHTTVWVQLNFLLFALFHAAQWKSLLGFLFKAVGWGSL